MTLTTAMLACIVVFVACAFVLRAHMRRLQAMYETRARILLAAEAVLLECGNAPDVDDVERQIGIARRNAATMRRHAVLFKLLWPAEFDGTYYSGERLIAQASRVVALASRGKAPAIR